MMHALNVRLMLADLGGPGELLTRLDNYYMGLHDAPSINTLYAWRERNSIPGRWLVEIVAMQAALDDPINLLDYIDKPFD